MMFVRAECLGPPNACSLQTQVDSSVALAVRLSQHCLLLESPLPCSTCPNRCALRAIAIPPRTHMVMPKLRRKQFLEVGVEKAGARTTWLCPHSVTRSPNCSVPDNTTRRRAKLLSLRLQKMCFEPSLSSPNTRVSYHCIHHPKT